MRKLDTALKSVQEKRETFQREPWNGAFSVLEKAQSMVHVSKHFQLPLKKCNNCEIWIKREKLSVSVQWLKSSPLLRSFYQQGSPMWVARVRFLVFFPLWFNFKYSEQPKTVSSVSPDPRRPRDVEAVLQGPNQKCRFWCLMDLVNAIHASRQLLYCWIFSQPVPTNCGTSWEEGIVHLFRDLPLKFWCLNGDFSKRVIWKASSSINVSGIHGSSPRSAWSDPFQPRPRLDQNGLKPCYPLCTQRAYG